MKKLFIFTAVLLAVAGMAGNANLSAMNEHYILKNLWAEYEKASRADKPQQMASVLEKIKTEAAAKHLAFDFYEAGRYYVSARTRVNWKLQEKVQEDFSREVESFGEPIVTYAWKRDFGGCSSDELWEYARQAKLSRGKNEGFYSSIHYMGGALRDFIRDDGEYVLWDLLGSRYYDAENPERDEICSALMDRVRGVYPQEGYLKYTFAYRLPKEKEKTAMEALAKEFSGTALVFYPRERLLQLRFEELSQDGKGTSEEFLALRKDCAEFEKERGALKGDEKKIAGSCDGPKNLIKVLDSKEEKVSIKGDSVVVAFRNTSSAVLTLSPAESSKKDAVLRKWTVKNRTGSYYVFDREMVAIPSIDDGSYVFRTEKASAVYEQYRYSLAVRNEADGIRVYAADFRSGKPLERAHLILRLGDAVKAEADIVFDGFTPLPKEMQSIVAASPRKYHTLECRTTTAGGKLLRSRSVSVRNNTAPSEGKGQNAVRCNIYKDRGAYNPGDTLSFKAILFKGDLVEKVSVMPGEKVEVVLRDSESKEIERKKLKTNEFGSVSDSFVLPKGLRNGYFTLSVLRGDREIGGDSFRVDEFILPTFSLDFEKNDRLYFPGDTVEIRGRVEAYSGHTLTGAAITAKIMNYSTVVDEIKLSPEADGSFSLVFPAAGSGTYRVEVTVTDATGETHGFSTYIYISSYIDLSLTPVGAEDAQFVAMDENPGNGMFWWRSSSMKAVFSSPEAVFRMEVRNTGGEVVPLPISYVLENEAGSEVSSGTVNSGEEARIAVPAPGLYRLKAVARTTDCKGEEIKDESEYRVLRVDPSSNVMNTTLRRLFLPGPSKVSEGGDIRLTFASTDGPTWAVVTLFGKGWKVLSRRKIALNGLPGDPGSQTTLTLPYDPSWPDAVRLQVFYFKWGDSCTYVREYTRERTALKLPLSFSRFTDKALPGQVLRFSLQSDPGAEALASVYDKSIDAIATNYWPTVSLRQFSVSAPGISSVCGVRTGTDKYGLPEESSDMFYGVLADAESVVGYGSTRIRGTNSVNRVMSKATVFSVEEEAAEMDMMAAAAPASPSPEEVTVRSKFENALTFQPFLRSDSKGEISFECTASDKLSTYHVSVFAHDKDMRNALISRDMVVSIPVKVSVQEPKYLYEGDLCDLSVSVSSVSDEPVSGKLYLYVYPGLDHEHLDPVSVQVLPITVEPKGVSSGKFLVRSSAPGGTVGVKAVFAAASFSDAVFVGIPVMSTSQTLTEAHSAVLRGDAGEKEREELLDALRSRFVNVPGAEATLTETTILDMVREAIPSKVDPSSDDVLSLSECWYVRLLSSRLSGKEAEGDDLLPRILACRNGDGGFGWFEGMNSSPIVTAVLLERFARLRDRGFDVPDLSSSVKFMDNRQFGVEMPYWCGWISDEKYMLVRSLYASVPFEVKQTKQNKERMTAFRKYAREYLVPSKERGLSGAILAKTRRLMTILQLNSRPGGKDLAKAWGISLMTGSRLKSSMKSDVESIVEYAVAHPDGGWYYPNAVMPWRGLLESEAYAHSLLCDLLSSAQVASTGVSLKAEGSKYSPADIAEGVRLWLMLQKETQKWDSDPAFVDALTSILDGSEATLSTRVLSLKATYTKPFTDIKAAGNGFTLERKFYRAVTVEEKYNNRTEEKNRNVSEWQEIQPSDPVSVGDRIVARYRIWNQENRSFVRLVSPREAALRPVEQLSGRIGWRLKPLLVNGLYSVSPQGYRNVKTDRTEYYFDTYPEETTEISEEFFVTEAGSFTAPVPSIESLYAPHYRANAGFPGPLVARF